MSNPYEASNHVPVSAVSPRFVRPLSIVALAIITTGSCLSLPGLFLLNQEWDVIAVNTGLIDIEYDGRSISAETLMRWSLSLGGAVVAAGVLLAAVLGFRSPGIRHRRRHATKFNARFICL